MKMPQVLIDHAKWLLSTGDNLSLLRSSSDLKIEMDYAIEQYELALKRESDIEHEKKELKEFINKYENK